ncbi:HAD-IC family P-type ATPase [Eshraghiella crossota]|jgi:cation-transporting ATPase E|uniref:HAD-IC family P-type ATPase n=1 Tax=Eshraghiella crossota TaxID=45851 RepID=UPI0009636BDC|nr:MAG: ATPase P [Butyrivibrio crossotus]
MDNNVENNINSEFNGLTAAEVNARIEAGKINIADDSSDRTTGKIIRDNLLTYFNLIFLVITVLLCIAGAFRDLTFLPIIIGNILIGIVQELRAKKTLDKMKILNAGHAVVIREGKRQKVTAEELVIDDLVWLSSGDAICADSVVVSGEITVNESMLTGEADGIVKKENEELLSGSFVVSGEGYARLTRVGNDSYISKLTNEAKALKKGEESEMIRSINMFVKVIGIIIIPMSVILFVQAFVFRNASFRTSITSMVASIIGLIPEGLYLLTTLALAVSMMKLAKDKVLLHDMKSIESLARVDVLCVDKTGTITKPEMTVTEIVSCDDSMNEVFTDYVMSSIDNNATAVALKKYLNDNNVVNGKRTASKVYPFNSTVKYGAMAFNDDYYVLGAPEFIIKTGFNNLKDDISQYTTKGYRVIVLAKAESLTRDGVIDGEILPLGFVVLANEIRDNAVETFTYFKEQGVAIKVISGDNPATVSEVARQAGIENAEKYVDASTLTDNLMISEAIAKYTVFGRVTPKQKQQFVKALKMQGHTVAMTGDGVNDILALKDADCSVAMASGSEATAQAAQIVLLDSDFSRMPEIVLEGRRVVNNVQRSASLFLVKNLFSLLLTIFSTVLMISYPLMPSQVSLISMFTIGIPGFLLALEPNKSRIKGHFLGNVLLKALPAGLTDFFAVSALVICGHVFNIPSTDIATASTLLIAVVGFMIMIKISHPFNKFKYGILALNIFGLIFCGLFLDNLFAMSDMSNICILLTIVFGFAAESMFRYITIFVEFIQNRMRKKKNALR